MSQEHEFMKSFGNSSFHCDGIFEIPCGSSWFWSNSAPIPWRSDQPIGNDCCLSFNPHEGFIEMICDFVSVPFVCHRLDYFAQIYENS